MLPISRPSATRTHTKSHRPTVQQWPSPTIPADTTAHTVHTDNLVRAIVDPPRVALDRSGNTLIGDDTIVNPQQ